MGFPVHHSEGVDMEPETMTSATPIDSIISVTIQGELLRVPAKTTELLAAPSEQKRSQVGGNEVRQRNFRRQQDEDNWFGNAP